MHPPCFPSSRRSLWLAASLSLTLTGCASFSPDGGLGTVESAVRPHLQQDIVWARDTATADATQARVAALLAAPLGADEAVQIALLNNPALQAQLHTLGIAEADRVAAGRLPNPGFSIGRLTRGSEIEWERSLHLNLMALLTLPLRNELEARRFEQLRLSLAQDILRLAADTRRAWIVAVAAQQTSAYQQQSMDAAEASAELARRMAEAGNWSALQRARQQAFYADAALAVARAEQARLASRERLARLLGLEAAHAIRLPERLPALPATLPALPDIEQAALDTRIDLQVARLQTEALAKNLGLTRRTRFINVLELGIVNNGSNEEPQQRGAEISFELPLFDFGEARVRGAEARYQQALSQVRAQGVNARAEIRETHTLRQSQYAIARHLADEVVPLRKRISDETLLRYNGMLTDTFALLADARAQIASVNAAIEAQRDYWLADAAFALARVGSPGALAVSLTSASAAAPADTGAH